MKCDNCSKSIFDEPFIRMNPKGEYGRFWCETCCKTLEPKTYQNELENRTPIEKDLIDICYPNKQTS